MKYLLFLVLSMCLTGCQSAVINDRPNEHSPYFQVPAGSSVILEKPLQISAEQNDVYFQNGQSMDWYAVNRYLPYCALKVASKQAVAQTIHPDQFVVRKSYTERFFNLVRADEALDIQPATFGSTMAGAAGQDHDGGMEYEVVATVMELSSERQPDVTALICTDWGVPQNASYITVYKIRRALGTFFKIELLLSGIDFGNDEFEGI